MGMFIKSPKMRAKLKTRAQNLKEAIWGGEEGDGFQKLTSWIFGVENAH
jgi:hypothetical protein